MLLIRWKKRLFACLILCLIGLAVLLCSQHRLRLAATSFVPVDSVELLRGAPREGSKFRYLAVPSDSVGRPRDVRDAIAILTMFDLSHPPPIGDALPTIDHPDTCILSLEQGRPLHCYNVDIGAASILAQHGFYSRMWDLAGPSGLGGFGHNLLEVWSDGSASWKVIDPYYHCFFTLGASDTPIGFATLRRVLLVGDTSVHAVRYFEYPNERTPARVIEELRFLVPCAMLHANNDFAWRYRHRYNGLMPLAPILDRLPLRAKRGLRTLLLGDEDTRYIIQDAASPHYSFAAMWWLARLLALGALGSGLILLISLVAGKHRN